MPAQVRNRLLAALPAPSRERLLSQAVLVALPSKRVLYPAGETPLYVYFIETGMNSVVTTMSDGDTAEVGTIGNEGAVGCLQLLGPGKVASNSFMQLDGSAFRVPFSTVRNEYRNSEETRDRILEFVQQQAICTAQIAACNRLHEAEKRLARWLLRAQDCTGSDALQFTQEFLSMMLGSRRTTVNMVAGVLHRAGLIEYQRGRVRIKDRERLEGAACQCYGTLKQLSLDLYRPSTPTHNGASVMSFRRGA